ncbi:hypothetical protein PAE9249_05301 [Paenibacillus sp. CECT 9249]|uniref:DUF6612 family protein n=1 Tax=Paenibacillus sp. CECT 9249 TaxID=2845385 RepID=UPI001E4A527C|nr:DUF6612 family protein [Paenibacillus sp. CECT 9249]CAH0122713.1 hypothetical protein PAE9249_05301 [Paenibacillus sp. CECT 9249]
MKRKIWLSMLACMLVVMVVLSGCASKKDPKESVQAAMENALKMNSYELTGSLKINELSVNDPALEQDPAAGMVLNLLKNAEVNVSGVFQKDPMQMEMTLEVKLQGDMAITLSVPMVITEDKMWMKIPNIPMLGLPESMVDKFIEIDMKKLAEEQGADLNVGALDLTKSQELSQELTKVVLGGFDGKTFFSDVNVKEAGLPEGVDAKQVVKFDITDSNLEQAVTVFVKDVLPQILDLMSSDKYKDMFQLQQEEIDKLKKEISDEAELKKALEELKKAVKINQFSITTAVSKDDYPVYQDVNANLDITNEGTTVKLGLQASSQYSKINEKVEFKIGIPTDVITMEELEQQFNSFGM